MKASFDELVLLEHGVPQRPAEAVTLVVRLLQAILRRLVALS